MCESTACKSTNINDTDHFMCRLDIGIHSCAHAKLFISSYEVTGSILASSIKREILKNTKHRKKYD